MEESEKAVGEVCNREVVVTGKSASMVEAAQLMRIHHVGGRGRGKEWP